MARHKSNAPGRRMGKRLRISGWLLIAGVVAAALVIVPGAASSFRLGKWVVFLGCAALGGFAWLIRDARTGSVVLPRSPLLGVLAVYPLLLAVSALWSPQAHVTLTAAADVAAWLLGVTALAALGGKALPIVTRWCLIAAAASAAVALLHAVGIFPFGFVASTIGERFQVIGLAGNPADLAAAAVIALPMVLLPGVWGKLRWPAAAVAALLIGAVAATRTLTAVGSVALAVVVLIVLGRGAWRRWAIIATVVFALAAGVTMGPRIGWKIEDAARGNWYDLLSARTDGWTAAAEMLRTHPVLGVGGAGYSCAFADARLGWLQRRNATGGRGEAATHFKVAHSDPLQTAAELGVAGILWMIALTTSIWRARPWRRPPVLAALASWLPMALFHYPGHLAVTLAPLAVLAAWLVVVETEERSDLSVPRPAVLVLIVLAGLATAATLWTGRPRLTEDRWIGEAERGFAVASRLPSSRRDSAMRVLERAAEIRLEGRRWDVPYLNRYIGRCRLARGAPGEAEQAFRSALHTCGHAEARLGLGLALINQGRRVAGLNELTRACRLNPTLLDVISDESVQRAVREALLVGERKEQASSRARDSARETPSGE